MLPSGVGGMRLCAGFREGCWSGVSLSVLQRGQLPGGFSAGVGRVHGSRAQKVCTPGSLRLRARSVNVKNMLAISCILRPPVV